MVAGVAVCGVGAVAEPVPPVAASYHNKFAPVAVNGLATVFWQNSRGLITTGGAEAGLTITVIESLLLSQVLINWLT